MNFIQDPVRHLTWLVENFWGHSSHMVPPLQFLGLNRCVGFISFLQVVVIHDCPPRPLNCFSRWNNCPIPPNRTSLKPSKPRFMTFGTLKAWTFCQFCYFPVSAFSKKEKLPSPRQLDWTIDTLDGKFDFWIFLCFMTTFLTSQYLFY